MKNTTRRAAAALIAGLAAAVLGLSSCMTNAAPKPKFTSPPPEVQTEMRKGAASGRAGPAVPVTGGSGTQPGATPGQAPK